MNTASEYELYGLLSEFKNSRVINILRTYGAGVSGSPVLAVLFESQGQGGLQGVHLVKFGTAEWALAEEEKFRIVPSGSERVRFGARVVRTDLGVGGIGVVAYAVHFESVLGTRPLAELIEGDGGTDSEAVHQITKVVDFLKAWTEPERELNVTLLTPQAILSKMLGSYADDIAPRLRDRIPLWPQDSFTIGIEGLYRYLPNPLAYLNANSWGENSVEVPCQLGQTHGDLHAGNIICSRGPDASVSLIDFSNFRDDGIPLLDLAYLEYDILQRLLPVEDPSQGRQWLALLDTVLSDILPIESPITLLAHRAIALLLPIRRRIYELCTTQTNTSFALERAGEIQWWAAVVAAGLLYARKDGELRFGVMSQQTPRRRACGLLYAAYGLEHLLMLLSIRAPRDAFPSYLTWFGKNKDYKDNSDIEPSLPWSTRRSNLPFSLSDLALAAVRQEDVNAGTKGLESRWPVVVIEGPAGTGKLALARVIANTCLSTESLRFDAVVSVTGETLPLGQGLETLLDEIAYQLDYPYVAGIPIILRQERVGNLLQRHQTLIIIDNFGSTVDQAVENWLVALPEPTKVLATTVEAGVLSGSWRLYIGGMNLDETRAYLHRQLSRREFESLRPFDVDYILSFLECAQGNPAVISLALGYLDNHASDVEHAAAALAYATKWDDYPLRAVLDLIWPDLKISSFRVLCALSFFAAPARYSALIHVTKLTRRELSEALNQLLMYSLIEISDNTAKAGPRYALPRFVRDYVSEQMDTANASSHTWEDQARKRWVSWYLGFTKHYGGIDWSEWAERFDELEDEWANLLALFEWCARRDTDEDLAILVQFWLEDRVHRFCDIYGHWQSRLKWFDWLIARSSPGHPTWAHAMMCKGWTLLHISQHANNEEIGELLSQAWAGRDGASAYVESEMANNFIYYYIQLKSYEKATMWIDEMFRIVMSSKMNSRLRTRQQLWTTYYRASIWYRKNRFGLADRLGIEVLNGARKISWQRMEMLALQLLAEITFKANEDEALQRYVDEGLRLARYNKDRTSTALFLYSSAHLELRLKHWDEARQSSTYALDLLERLGMMDHADAMRVIVRKCNRHKMLEKI